METELDNILTRADLLAGCVASKSGELPEITDKIKIKFKLFSEVFGAKEAIKVEQLKPSELIMLSVNTAITVGMIKTINPKDDSAEVRLRIPIVPIKSENIGLARNIGGHWRLIGFGELV
jgi:translation initiation factor 2 subunit 3